MFFLELFLLLFFFLPDFVIGRGRDSLGTATSSSRFRVSNSRDSTCFILSDKTIFIFCVICFFRLYCCLHARIQIDMNVSSRTRDDKNTFRHKVNAAAAVDVLSHMVDGSKYELYVRETE